MRLSEVRLFRTVHTQTMSGSTSNFNEFKRQVDSCHFELLLFAQNSQNIVHLSKNKHPSYFHMVYTIRTGILHIHIPPNISSNEIRFQFDSLSN